MDIRVTARNETDLVESEGSLNLILQGYVSLSLSLSVRVCVCAGRTNNSNNAALVVVRHDVITWRRLIPDTSNQIFQNTTYTQRISFH